ncbi:MAG: hypothetical protein NTX05_04990 [Fusobacteria bacterium]|nr:hypothetical protein [Fusobacteriota bacterium]
MRYQYSMEKRKQMFLRSTLLIAFIFDFIVVLQVFILPLVLIGQ